MPAQDEQFWITLDNLVASSQVIIDRPRGTVHPRYPDFIYPFDYGYLEYTQASDGGGIDVWVGSLPQKTVSGVIATVDLVKRDAEVKILIGCTEAEARQILETHNSGPQSGILIYRNLEEPLTAHPGLAYSGITPIGF